MTNQRICAYCLPLLLMLVLPCAAARNTDVIADPAYTHARQRIEVEPGRRLNLYCSGRGVPTVVFDSGLGDGTKAWGLVQPAIARHTRACSYDRAGLGFSDPAYRPGTSANAVDDLHRLLHAAGIAPPYVMVGHSYGGMNMKLYAETRPGEVAGMVLVDPSHEDLGKRLWQLDPDYESRYLPYIHSLQPCLHAKPADLIEGSELFKTCVGTPAGPRYSAAINAVELQRARQPGRIDAWISEQENIWFASADQVRAARRSLGDIPLIVLTKAPQSKTVRETQELRDKKNRVWVELHARIAALSSRGTRRVVADSGHAIQQDQPQAVIAAILDVLHAVTAH